MATPSSSANGFEDFLDPYEEEDDGLPEEEEDYLDFLLAENDEEEPDDNWIPTANYMSSQSSIESDVFSEDTSRVYWKDENVEDTGAPDPRTVRFKPKRKPGIHLGRLSRSTIHSLTSPISFFRLYMTGLLLTSLCLATNLNAEHLIRKGQFKSYAGSNGMWQKVTEEEMEKFIGILIYMSFTKLHSLDRYWSNDILYKFNPIPSAMSVRRFKAILAFLQITPLPDIDKSDKMTRVQPMVDHVTTVSEEIFQPYEKVAVDERIVKSKHRYSGIRQFMKDKPVKFGIKLWVLADTATGFTCNFFVYLGKKRTVINDLSKGLAYSVVTYLTKGLMKEGYRLFIDSFYTTLNLVKDLYDVQLYLIGAMKRNSSAMPDCFKISDGWEKIAGRGDFRWHRFDKFVVVQWKDCKVVSIISPVHQGSKLNSCQRTIQGRSGWKKKCVKQPDCINSYNEGMFGVDKSNQYLSRYPCYLKTKFHWWKVLFFHCLDIMIVNSFIIFQEFRKEYPEKLQHLPQHFGQLEFREYIVKALLSLDTGPTIADVDVCMPSFYEQSKRQRCTYCYAEAKLNGNSVPNNKTMIYCKVCKVSLCLFPERNCFEKWHSVNGKYVKEWVNKHGKKKD